MKIKKIRKNTIEKGSQKMKMKRPIKLKKKKLKLNVDQQQDAMKHLKENCDIDDINLHEQKRLCVYM